MTAYAIGINTTVMDNFTQNNDVRTLAQEFTIYKIGKLINNFWIYVHFWNAASVNFLSTPYRFGPGIVYDWFQIVYKCLVVWKCTFIQQITWCVAKQNWKRCPGYPVSFGVVLRQLLRVGSRTGQKQSLKMIKRDKINNIQIYFLGVGWLRGKE